MKKSLRINRPLERGSRAERSIETLPCDSERENDLPIDILLDMERKSYEESGNPVYALRAFLISRESKMDPAEWVMDWIERSFKEYWEASGRKDLDALLRFTGSKGRDPAFKEFLIKIRNDVLLTDIARLRGLFDLSLDEATYMVERRLEETPESEFNNTQWPIERPHTRRLKDLYSRSPIFKKIEKDIKKIFGERWTDKEKRNYLRGYPRDSFPEKIQAYLVRSK